MGTKQGDFIGGNMRNEEKVKESSPGFTISVRVDIKKLAAIARFFEQEGNYSIFKGKGSLLKNSFDLLYQILENNKKLKEFHTVDEAAQWLEGKGLGPSNKKTKGELANSLAFEEREFETNSRDFKEPQSQEEEKEIIREICKKRVRGEIDPFEFAQQIGKFISRDYTNDILDEFNFGDDE